jgi:uncharacterized OB-fold protein
MATGEERKCPDCATVMHPIRLIDKTQAGAHADLEYSLPEAKRSFWMARYPVEGKVGAYMCDHCARILLYGESLKST